MILVHERAAIRQVPEDWIEGALRDFAEIDAGINKPLADMGTGTLYVTVQDLYDGTSIDIQQLGRIRVSSEEIQARSLEVGDIVLGKSSVKRDGIGYPSRFLGSDEPAVFSGFSYRVRARRELVDATFLFHQLRAPKIRRWVIDNSQSSALTNLNRSIADAIPVVLPPLAEQEAIAEALSDADAVIESIEQLLTKKRQLKQGAVQELLTGRRRLPGFSGGWDETQLGDLAAFHKGKGLSKSALNPFGHEPCIHYGELFTRYRETIREVLSRTDDSSDCVRSVANDVLMPTSDVTPDGLAKASCIEASGVILGGDILVIRPDSSRLFGSFLSYLVRHSEDQILQLVSGTTVFHLYAADMKQFTFFLPSTSEQQAIVGVLDDMDAELAALDTKLAKARQIKQGMMQELLAGRIRLV